MTLLLRICNKVLGWGGFMPESDGSDTGHAFASRQPPLESSCGTKLSIYITVH
jgi:hypothetical protein